MGDVVLGILAENFAKALCTFKPLCIQSISSITGFLSVSNEVDCGIACCYKRSNGDYTVRQKPEHDVGLPGNGRKRDVHFTVTLGATDLYIWDSLIHLGAL